MNLSVIIPAYQCSSTLPQTIVDVLSAGLPLLEILLIDDGSTDGTAALCDRLAQENPLVRCIHKGNGGVSSARNLGIAEAKGDYLWFVDADDTVLPIPADELAHLEMENCSTDMLLFGVEYEYCRKDRVLRREMLRIDQRLDLTAQQIGLHFHQLFYRNYLSPVWNKLIKRRILIENGIRFDPALNNYEDLAFSLHVLSVCRRITALPAVYYRYKGDYDHDRTIDRIGRIDNVAENTDRIAEAFFSVSRDCGFDEHENEQLRKIVLMIYLDLFRVKMQTTPLWKIRKQCVFFASDVYFRQCADILPKLSSGVNKLFRRILVKQVLPIWAESRYKMLRHCLGRFIKPILKRA